MPFPVWLWRNLPPQPPANGPGEVSSTLSEVSGMSDVAMGYNADAAGSATAGTIIGHPLLAMPNVASLQLEFCPFGHDQLPCVWRQAKVSGQVCDPELAKEIGTGKPGYAGEVTGSVMPGYRYTAWRCETENPADRPPSGTSGLALN